jgi:hypothetical protein
MSFLSQSALAIIVLVLIEEIAHFDFISSQRPFATDQQTGGMQPREA